MSLFLTNQRPNRGDVSVRIHKVLWMWIWSVSYEGLPVLFDRMGVVRTRKKAINKTIKHVQRIIRYENKETNG